MAWSILGFMGRIDHKQTHRARVRIALSGIVAALSIASAAWLLHRAPNTAAMPQPPAAEDKQQPELSADNISKSSIHRAGEPARRQMNIVPQRHDDDRYDGKVIGTSGRFVRQVTVYQNCGIARTDSGCDLKTYYDHPYKDFSFEDLHQIANFDAVAAFILAERIFTRSDYQARFDGDTWYQAGVNHYLNAAVLSGHTEPYEKMLVARGLMQLGDDYSARNRHKAREMYIWGKVGIDLGYLAANHASMDIALRYFSRNPSVDPDMRIEKLDEEAHAIKQFLINLKANTTG